jgi:Pectate lyase superfamily protein
MFNVKDYGAVGDGVADDTVAFQRTLDAIRASLVGGTMVVPSGKYLLSAQLTYSSRPLAILGEDMELSELRWNSVAAGFKFTMGAISSQRVNSLRIERLSLVATQANCGAAIQASWDNHTAVAPMGMLEDIKIIQENNGYWTHGLHLKNMADSVLRRIYAMMYGDQATSCVWIENPLDSPNFGIMISDSTFNGSQTTLNSTGWLESLYIDNSSFVGGTDTIVCDGSGTKDGCAHLIVSNSHLNAKRSTIRAINWRTIFLNSADIYHGVGTDDQPGNNLDITNAKNLNVSGCKFETGAPNLPRTAIFLNDVIDFAITGNVLSNFSAAAIIVDGSTTRNGSIGSNVITGWADGTRNNEGIYIGGIVGELTITGNVIRYFHDGVQMNAPDGTIAGNTIIDCDNGVVVSTSNTCVAGNAFKNVTNP